MTLLAKVEPLPLNATVKEQIEALAEIRRREHPVIMQQLRDEAYVLRFSLKLAQGGQEVPRRGKVGDGVRVPKSGLSRRIYDHCNGHPIHIDSLTKATNASPVRLRDVARSMVASGYLTRTSPGHFIRRVATVAAMLLLCVSTFAQVPVPPPVEYPGIILAWDKPSDASVTGFWVYLGVKSRSYTNAILVGTNQTYTFTSLLPNLVYYFAATSTDAIGAQSDFSNEVSATMKTNYPPTTNATVYMWIEASPNVTGPFTNANLYTKSMTNAPNLFYRLWISK